MRFAFLLHIIRFSFTMILNLKPLIFKLVLSFLILAPSFSHGQLFPQASEVEDKIEIPDDSLGRRTPRGTVSGYFQAVSSNNYERASAYFNLKKSLQNDAQRKRLVSNLQQLLDNSGNLLPYSLLSNDFAGKLDDDLAPEIDVIGTMKVDGEEVKLYVENTAKSGEAPMWLISSSTINLISSAKAIDELPLDKLLPSYLEETVMGGVPIGHWIAIIVMIVLAYYAAKIVFILLIWILKIVWKKSATDPIEGIVKALALPFQIYLGLWLFVILSQEIGISIIVRQKLSNISMIVGIVAFLLLLWRLTDFISGVSRRKMNQHGRVSAVSIILFLRRFIKVAIIVFGVIIILGTIGFDVTAGIAALGIGGIALALGAQKSVENFVGSVTLIADQPIRVGDFCTAAGITGTVEQIGMRSTRIRTQNRTLVTIPNGEFSSASIENFAHRDKFLMKTLLGLRYETTPDQIRFLLVEIRKILYSHPMVNNDPARVRFVSLGSSSLDLEVFVYINAPDYDTFLEVQEDIYLRIMDTVASSGTDFAFPSQTLYFAKDSGLSTENGKAAEERVKNWIKDNDMQLPKFDENRISQINDSIEYPPKGSTGNKKP